MNLNIVANLAAIASATAVVLTLVYLSRVTQDQLPRASQTDSDFDGMKGVRYRAPR